jgi:8-oxo-dGTP pyrophosphatase MutT (NUDIX family)
MADDVKHKAYAYVTRRRNGRTQLLVFEHRGLPSAGVQVPGGSVEPGEDVAVAAARELTEESGLTDARLVAAVDEYHWFHADSGRRHHRHVFHFTADDAPDAWSIRPLGENETARAFTFDFRWIDLADAPRVLAGGLGRSVARLLSVAEAGE